MLTGLDDKLTVEPDGALITPDGVFVQFSDRQILIKLLG